ncbi:MAG: iron-sulfur cluster carrier protein ApbC [Cohaesibacter sp.]|nr:iron-sulfur cluster carrier protein ApbC [Cohaesibacter sp.]
MASAYAGFFSYPGEKKNTAWHKWCRKADSKVRDGSVFWNKNKAPAGSKVTSDDILTVLKKLKLQSGGPDIVELGMVSDIFINEGSIIFSLTVDAEQAQAMEPLRAKAQEVVEALPGVEKVMVALTAEKRPGTASATPPPPRPAAKPAGPAAKPAQGAGGHKLDVQGVKHIVAVSSAKGGVGKSTTSVNLALALQANGLKVGILDADIYGPSIPRLLGIKGRPMAYQDKILKPMEGFGLKAMSVGFLVDEDTPMIWRGPMVVSALTQMMRDVKWDIDGELDVLVVDMPPGTGDIQLTMAQQVPLSGSVIVSTPQDLALLDARKGIAMFEKVNIPILGVVENMSYFLCPSCGDRHDIFGHGGAREIAEKIGVPFLGEVPLHMDIRERSDAGRPIVATDADSEHSTIYRQIARSMAEELAGAGRQAPQIIIE